MAKTAKPLPKKGDKIKYKVGLAPKPIKGTVVRVLKSGTPFPGKLVGKIRTTYNANDPLSKDSVLVETEGGELRLISVGYIQQTR